MNERSIITDHIQALISELKQAEANIGLPQIDENLRDRMWIRFGQLIEDQQQDLQMVQDEVDNDIPLDVCWDAFRDIRTKCQPILRECLALTQGALSRGRGPDEPGLDDRLCQTADFLLDGLSGLTGVPWGRFTILAEGEFFGEMAAIIRLRYPGTSIWDLPVAAHEFGHFVIHETEELRVDGRFGNYVQQYEDLLPRSSSRTEEDRRALTFYKQAQRSFLHEYYADIFATYALGPAYAYTCLLLRFDPKTAYTDGQEHPSYEKRAQAILQTLKEMNKVYDSAWYYSGIIGSLRTLWQGSVRKARPSGQPASEEKSMLLEDLVATLHTRLGRKMPHVRYGGWPQAAVLSDQLMEERPATALGTTYKLRDVLNAAWQYRINARDGSRRGNDDDALVYQAKNLCEKIVARSRQNPMASV